MTLRTKTLLITGITIGCLTLILLTSVGTLLSQKFAALETQDMEKNLKRSQNILAVQVKELDTVLSDWAFWDDAYDFVDTPSEEYIKKNLNDGTYAAQQLNFIVYTNRQGQIVYGQGFDLGQRQFMALPNGLMAHLQPASPLLSLGGTDSYLRGIVLLPEGAVFIAARPILDTNRQKEPRGVLILGRFIDEAVKEELSDTAQLSLDLYPLNRLNLPDDIQIAGKQCIEESNSYIQALDEERIGGYALLRDIYQQPALMLRVDTPRYIYRQGKETLNYFTVVFLLLGTGFAVINLLFLEKTVLARLSHLIRQVIHIGRSKNPDAAVEVTGKDELGSLSQEINGMLKSLLLAQNEVKNSEVITRMLLEGIPDSLVRIDSQGVILDCKTGRSRLLGLPSRLLAGRNIFDVYPKPVSQPFLEAVTEALASGNQQVFEREVEYGESRIRQEFRIAPLDNRQAMVIIRDFD